MARLENEYESEVAGEEPCYERVDVSPEGGAQQQQQQQRFIIVPAQPAIGRRREEVRWKPVSQFR